jgi:hypothetical protein
MVAKTEADFSGWATKANLRCSDGRTITPDAFAHQDQATVPLVWQHVHNEPTNVLGHAVLENRPEGVYAWGFFNSTEKGQGAKVLVQHGDVTALSIYANQLVEKNKSVMHGQIRELSLVLAGANPGALIDNVSIKHADGSYDEVEDEVIISMGLPLEHSEAEVIVEEDNAATHADGGEKTVQDVFDTLSEEQKKVVYYMIGQAASSKKEVAPVSHAVKEDVLGLFASMNDDQKNVVGYMLNEAIAHADEDDEEDDEPDEAVVEHADDSGKTVQDVFDTLNEEQKNVVYYMLAEALKSAKGEAPAVAHADQSDIRDVFNTLNDEQKNVVAYMVGEALAHADEFDVEETDSAALAGAEDNNAAAHADKEGTTMANVFESGSTSKVTENTLSHDDLQGIIKTAETRKTTFKSELEAYALAHGIDDIEILFPDARPVTNGPEFLARRSEWVATVMSETKHTPFSRIKSLVANLTFEAARAKGYVKGNFKKEEFVRVSKRVTGPTTVYKKQKLDRDDVLDITDFDIVAWLKGEMRLMLEEEIARAVLLGDGRLVEDDDKINEENIRPIATDSDFYVTYLNVDLGSGPQSAEALIDALVLNRRHYRGSGNPVLFTSETVLSRLLLIRDTVGRRIYSTVTDLEASLRVSKVITVELMDEPINNVLAIMVNLADYTIGADRGGDVAMFDDFDIDYNQQKYLIETRLSGALTKPKSAIVVKKVAVGTTLRTPAAPTYDPATHTITIPTSTGVTYRNKATNAVLTGTVVLAPEQEVNVIATPASGTDYLASTAGDEWFYTYESGLNSSAI